MADASWAVDVIVIFILLICSGFFSGSETGLTAVSKGRIYKLLMEGDQRAQKVIDLREKKEALIGTILLGNNMVNIAATALSTSLAIRLFGDEGVFFVTVVLTLLVLVFSEILPKTYAIQNAEKVALITAPILTPLTRIFAPITYAIQWFITRGMRIIGIDLSGENALISATDAIRGTIELHHQEGDVVKHERDMLGSILDLARVDVADVMVHRKQMDTIDASQSVTDIIKQAINSSHSRIPLWENEPDNIIGILHVKDLLSTLADRQKKYNKSDVLALLSPAWFVPENTTLSQQLHAFRQKKRHFAVVVDEYGACEGIITLEDILEEIVGDIMDEHDVAGTSGVKLLQENTYLVKGSVTIRDLNRLLDWNLPDEHVATVAGLLIHEARSIPEKGATFMFYNYRFTVEEKRANQILQMVIQRVISSDDET